MTRSSATTVLPRAHLEAKAHARFGVSPCAASRKLDYVVHRVLPELIRRRRPRLAARLEATSPRWGWRNRVTAGS